MITSHTEVAGGAVLRVRGPQPVVRVVADLYARLVDAGYDDISTARARTGTWYVSATDVDGSRHQWVVEIADPDRHAAELAEAARKLSFPWIPHVVQFLQSIYGPRKLYR